MGAASRVLWGFGNYGQSPKLACLVIESQGTHRNLSFALDVDYTVGSAWLIVGSACRIVIPLNRKQL